LTISISLIYWLLGFFKYFNFGLEGYNALKIQEFGVSRKCSGTLRWQVVLPLGIRFYTIQASAYTIDVFRGERREWRTSSIFLLRLDVPHLVAGRSSSFSFLADQLQI